LSIGLSGLLTEITEKGWEIKMIFDEIRELEKSYSEGTIPEAADFEGEFYVVVPWFPWFSLELLKHRKAADSLGEGDNIILDNIRFGRFRLEKEQDALLINYDQPENPPVMKGVIDRMRRLADGRLVGKLYYKILGREVFIMFFEMRKKEV
jgi:hypothetical protein